MLRQGNIRPGDGCRHLNMRSSGEQLRSFLLSGLKLSARLFFMFLLAGCAGLFTRAAPLPVEEKAAVTAAFEEMLAGHRQCGCCLDAAVEIKLSRSSLFGSFSGAMAGYLQAMAPSFLKFVGVGPLGQPVIIYVSDGKIFRSVLVPEARVIEGSVRSGAFSRYTPAGFDPESSYFWLTGRLTPGSFEIVSVSRAAEGGYWLELRGAGQKGTSHFLFDPGAGVVSRHVERDEQQTVVMDIAYADYPAPATDRRQENACSLPRRISVNFTNYNAELSIRLQELLPGAALSADDFNLVPPPGFALVVVE